VRLARSLFFLVLFATNAQASDYEVKGAVRVFYFLPKGDQLGIPVHFLLSVHGCMWNLVFNRDETNGLDYQQVTFDGTNLYYVIDGEHMAARAKASGKKLAGNVANSFISNDGEIFHNPFAPEVGTIWLAYGSSCFFADLKTNLMEPPVDSDGIGRKYSQPEFRKKLRVDYQRVNDALGLPSQVVYFDDSVNIFGKRAPAPYDNGFTNSIYSVNSWTNCGGIQLPLTASFKFYYVKSGGTSSNDLALFKKFEISFEEYKKRLGMKPAIL